WPAPPDRTARMPPPGRADADWATAQAQITGSDREKSLANRRSGRVGQPRSYVSSPGISVILSCRCWQRLPILLAGLGPRSVLLFAFVRSGQSDAQLCRCADVSARPFPKVRASARQFSLRVEVRAAHGGSTAMASIETRSPWGRSTFAGAERAGGGSGMCWAYTLLRAAKSSTLA